MLRRYTPRRTEEIIASLSPLLDQIEKDYSVPAACMKAVLYREMTEIDLFDAAADLAVRLGWLGRLIGKNDSSTGYAQIFASVAARALRFAEERGIETAEGLGLKRSPSPEDPGDLREIWLRLNRDREFNLRLAALNLLSAAEEVTGRLSFPDYSEDETKRIFSRYNANTKKITSYGETVWKHFLRYRNEGMNNNGKGDPS
ncbi:MAG: hypothetical protein II680_05475 [Clostridia bacterium]|nr:hypothetical protein [Clostridia bacterium]